MQLVVKVPRASGEEMGCSDHYVKKHLNHLRSPGDPIYEKAVLKGESAPIFQPCKPDLLLEKHNEFASHDL